MCRVLLSERVAGLDIENDIEGSVVCCGFLERERVVRIWDMPGRRVASEKSWEAPATRKHREP